MKVPANPPATFTTEPRHLRPFRERLWRIYRSEGPHALAWDELRHWGPATDMRFDPHPEPSQVHPTIGVMYAAADPITSLAEVFQEGRDITRSVGGATLVGWDPSRELTLLDLTTNWPVKNGAAASMQMDAKHNTHAWAEAIHDHLGADIDGLYHLSSMTGAPIVTLFTRVERDWAFPTRPVFHEPLSDSSLNALMIEATDEIGYDVT